MLTSSSSCACAKSTESSAWLVLLILLVVGAEASKAAERHGAGSVDVLQLDNEDIDALKEMSRFQGNEITRALKCAG